MKNDQKKNPGKLAKQGMPNPESSHCHLFEELFSLSPTPYFLVGPEGVIFDLNESAAGFLETERARLLNTSLVDFFSGQPKIEFEAFIKRLFANNTMGKCLVPFSGKNPLHSMIQFTGLVSREKQVCFLTAVDITFQNQLEEKLMHERRLLRTLIDHLPDTLYIKDAEARKIIANPADVEVTGFRSETEIVGKTDLEIFPGEVGRRGYDDDQRVLKGKLPALEREEDFFDNHGNQRWLLTSKIPLRDEQGKIIGLVGIGRDITARKRVEKQLARQTEQLKELNSTKDKFFSIIAHDLRSPFGTIMGLSEMLFADLNEFDKEEIGKFLGMITASSHQAYSLLENLLLWARNQRGTMGFQPEVLEVQKRIQENINLVQSQADKKQIGISSLVKSHLVVMADKNMLDTILRNLLTNAIKFTPHNGSIVVNAEKSKGFVEISITDTGVGIAREELENIFKIGGKPSAFGTDNEKGSGLGLILCREFVERHKGSIRVESEIGKGSSFRFTIPGIV